MLTEGRSLSGHERNCGYLNTGWGTFANVSSAAGFDFPSDTRGLASVDWDHDGDLDVWLSNRTSPRLRFLRNERLDVGSAAAEVSSENQHFVAFRLRGVSCNRDAIGARVTVHLNGTQSPTRTRTIRAGEGYLSQSSKWLHFGLGSSWSISHVQIQWPGGQQERIGDVLADQQFEIVQGTGTATPWQRPGSPSVIAGKIRPNLDEPVIRPIRIVPHRRLPLPKLEFTAADSQLAQIEPAGTKATLVVVWATWCAPCIQEISHLLDHQEQLQDASVSVITLCADAVSGSRSSGPTPWGIDAIASKASQVLTELGANWPGGVANEATMTKLDALQRVLVNRESSLPLP